MIHIQLFEDHRNIQKIEKFAAIIELWQELHNVGASANWITNYMKTITVGKRVLYNVWQKTFPLEDTLRTQVITDFRCTLDDNLHKAILNGEYVEENILFFNNESIDFFNSMYIYDYTLPIQLEEELTKMKRLNQFDL